VSDTFFTSNNRSLRLGAVQLNFELMPTLVIRDFPEDLHARLSQMAVTHGRSIAQEAIHMIEVAMAMEVQAPSVTPATKSKWANRKLLPEYEALLKSGALSGGTDSTQIISEERDAR
jgi:plasmid stability protein